MMRNGCDGRGSHHMKIDINHTRQVKDLSISLFYLNSRRRDSSGILFSTYYNFKFNTYFNKFKSI